jgi:hypothetical protein
MRYRPLSKNDLKQPNGLLLIYYRFEPGHKSIIYPIFQFFAGFEKWELFRFDDNLGPGLGVSAGVALVMLDKKTAKPADLNPLSLSHGICHIVKKDLNHLCGFRLGDIRFGLQGGDELQLIHKFSFLLQKERSKMDPIHFLTDSKNKKNRKYDPGFFKSQLDWKSSSYKIFRATFLHLPH